VKSFLKPILHFSGVKALKQNFFYASVVSAVVYTSTALSAEINVYSSRHYDVDKEIISNFEKKTKHKVNVVQVKEAAQLVERLKSEGNSSPADILMTVDVGNLERASAAGLFVNNVLSNAQSKTLPQTQDAKKEWVALSIRARIIAFNKDKIKPTDVETYESLQQEKFKGKILVRSSNHVYNQSLVSSFIANFGEEKAKAWASGVKANLARKPEGGDTDQLKAIVNGIGDVAIVNSYYFARALSKKEGEGDPSIASKVGIVFPNQKTTGTHINVSGAGVLKSSKNKQLAAEFIEHWLSAESQKLLASANREYPAIQSVDVPEELKAFGKPLFDKLQLSEVAKNHEKAILLLDTIGWR
jgi:iron(III) transport system substrate-binding protein